MRVTIASCRHQCVLLHGQEPAGCSEYSSHSLQQGGGLLPEVEAFDDFHEEHGATGGWHPDDHSEFERILKICKGDYSHATLMCYDQMVGFKRADIIAHAR